MRKEFICLLSVIIVLIAGCGPNPPDDLSKYKGIAWADLPDACVSHGNDVCALFDCMVPECWCDDLSPESPILYEPENKMLQTKQEALEHVNSFLDENEGYAVSAKRAVKLDNIFFNVFCEDEEGNEVVFTVAVDGIIFKTICGV